MAAASDSLAILLANVPDRGKYAISDFGAVVQH